MSPSIDERIESALSDESLHDPGLRDMLTDIFHSRLRWLNLIAGAWTFAIFGLGVYCAVRLFNTVGATAAVQWGVGVVLCFLAVGLLKAWFWQVMHRNTLLRAIKRLELLLARTPRP
jgi:hypothetical protein